MEISATDWAALSSLVDEALDCEPAARKAWFAESASVRSLSDDQRKKLEHLIAQSNETESGETDSLFATLPQFALKAHRYVDTFTGGDRVGPYRLIEKIGTGGMSEVWSASRCDGAYERNVALKLPFAHASVASREHFIRRMERERDLLARLEHPNIARFYDAGIAKTELGAQPYLALELIEGKPLIEYANANRLTIEARCKLFLQVLDAVQYAHQRFVVHRDLKPSNILVRENGQVALLDFGIAKVLDEETQIGDATMLTREMGRAITLAYASPEQLLSEPITTASDVYSAGVLFYELLCGKRPFAGRDHSMMSLLGVFETPPPSLTSVIRSAEDIEPTQFGAPSKKSLTNLLSGDLAAIASKSLRRDAAQRYASASAFAEDLQRFLTDQPVHARDGARWYTLQKFLWRNRVALTFMTVGLAAIATLGVTALLQQQASRESSAQAASVERLLDGMLQGMSPDMAETTTFSAHELLDRAVASLSSGISKGENHASLKIAYMYERIGAYDSAKALYRRMAEEFEKQGDYLGKLRTLIPLAMVQMNERSPEASSRLLDEIEKCVEKVGPIPDDIDVRLRYVRGWHHLTLGQATQALERFDEVERKLVYVPKEESDWRVRYWSSRADAYHRLRDFAKAETSYVKALEICHSIGKACELRELTYRVRLALTRFEQKRYSEIVTELPQTLSRLESRFADNYDSSLRARYLIAASELYLGNPKEARLIADRLLKKSKASSEYHVLAKSLLVLTALAVEPASVVEQELREWMESSAFDVPDYITPERRSVLADVWKTAHLIGLGQNKEAKQLIDQVAQVTAARQSAHEVAYLSAVAELRLGKIAEANRSFRSLLAKYGEQNQANSLSGLAAKAYLSALPNSDLRLDLAEQQMLQDRFRWSHEIVSMLKEVNSAKERKSWHDFPFLFVLERNTYGR